MNKQKKEQNAGRYKVKNLKPTLRKNWAKNEDDDDDIGNLK